MAEVTRVFLCVELLADYDAPDLMHWIAPSKKDAADQFRAKIQNLRRTRDLLPHLLSGQVNLKES